MKLLDLTFKTSAENLACDEALLEFCEEDGVETLRVWESEQHFVVVGYGNSVDREVNVENCRARGISIFRRCSGGGTVLQGPGCLNYSLALRVEPGSPLENVTSTNEFVMQRNRSAIAQIIEAEVSVQGHTDLAYAAPDKRWWKFSGNAQRRRRRALMFHGTILHGFELAAMDSLLRLPSVQPDYRAHRAHSDFVRNIPATAEQIRNTLRLAWKAEADAPPVPLERMEALLRTHYLNEEWTLRR